MRLELSDAEWKVMNAVWAHRLGVTARDVMDAVEGKTGWAYTTVKTMLDRLTVKGALSTEREGKILRFRARITRGAARQAAARGLLERAFAGDAGPLVHHLVRSERLSEDERNELRRMLDAQEDQE